MKPPSIPQINKSDPKKWFIYWNHDVPFELWHLFPRKRMRVVRIGNINDFKGDEREKNAEFWRQVWQYQIDVMKYSPFDEDLAEYRRILNDTAAVQERIEEVKEVIKEDSRMLLPIDQALGEFIKSRSAMKLAKTTISSYQSSVDWIKEGLSYCGYGGLPIGRLKHTQLSEAIDYISEEREWSATTINKEVSRLMTIFDWLAVQDYIIKNPSKGKFQTLPTNKSKHRWYDRDIAKTVKEEVLIAKKDKVYLAMQFTYWLMIRSKKELRALKIGDIDRTLKRIRFRPELSKNKKEQYRDYPEEFEKTLETMDLRRLPLEWYVFGKTDGTPGPVPCSHNYFSKQFKVIKDKIGLSPDYTIYGWKHTRIVHELMKGTDGRDISDMARHSDFKTTKEYLRDYDLTLKNIYGPEDLKW